MKDLHEFYTNRVNGYEEEIGVFNQRLLLFSTLRLVVFLATIMAIYFASSHLSLFGFQTLRFKIPKGQEGEAEKYERVGTGSFTGKSYPIAPWK